MDGLTVAVASFAVDVENYLTFVESSGQPNYKYFNYVLNRMGLSCIYTSKHEIFKQLLITTKFVEKSLVVLKLKFLREKSNLKRAALIYMLCKVFFTDDIASKLKLRITCDEFEEFKLFSNQIKDQPEYLVIRIIFYQLFTENFFNVTVKNKRLALDYGSPADDDIPVYGDHNEAFWKEIRNEFEVLEKTDVVELKQLNEIREEVAQPFKSLFPEQNPLSEALQDFDAVKSLIQAPPMPEFKPYKITRKRKPETFNSPGVGSSTMLIKAEDSKSEAETESDITSPEKLERRRLKKAVKQEASDQSSSSEGEEDFRRMIRSLGYESQNVMKGIGASVNISSEKLKKVYESKS